MRRIAVLTASFVFAVGAFGQTEPEKKAEANADTAPPAITEQFKTEFFKAQSDLNQAELLLERTNEYQQNQQKAKVFKGVVDKLTAICAAKKMGPSLDPNGWPTCQAKLAPPTTPPAPPAAKPVAPPAPAKK